MGVVRPSPPSRVVVVNRRGSGDPHACVQKFVSGEARSAGVRDVRPCCFVCALAEAGHEAS